MFAPSTVKAVEGLHKGGRLCFGLTPKLRALGFYLDNSPSNTIIPVIELLTIVMMEGVSAWAFSPLSSFISFQAFSPPLQYLEMVPEMQEARDRY